MPGPRDNQLGGGGVGRPAGPSSLPPPTVGAEPVDDMGLVPIDPSTPGADGSTLQLLDGRTMYRQPDGSYGFTPAPPAGPPLPPPETAPPMPDPVQIDFPGRGTATLQPDGQYLFEPVPGADFATVITDTTIATPGTLLNITGNFTPDDRWTFVPTPAPPTTDPPANEVMPATGFTSYRGLIATMATLATVAVIGVGIANTDSSGSELVVPNTAPVASQPLPTATQSLTIPMATTATAATAATTDTPDAATGEERSINVIRGIIERCYGMEDYSGSSWTPPSLLAYTAVAGNPYTPALQGLAASPADFYTVTVSAGDDPYKTWRWVVNPDTAHHIASWTDGPAGGNSFDYHLRYAVQCAAGKLSRSEAPTADNPFP